MTPKVQYTYSDGSANQVRPTSMTYPNGRAIGYGYGASGGMDDGLSRLASISDGGASRASFKYLGLSTPVRTEFTEPGLCQDLWGGVSGQYSGLDPFLRVKDLRWTGSGGDRVRVKHGYDRDSNRLWRENPVAAAASKPQDQLYAYDNLNRLIQMQRGLLNVPHTGLTQKDFEQAWGLDKAGNWSQFRQDDDGGGTWDLDQSRRTNKGNEIVAIGSQSGSAWAAPGHDPTGNMRSFPKPAAPTGSFGAKYDAWNRLVRVTDGEATVAEYAYDGRSFRTRKRTYESGVIAEERDYYYSSGWQVLEERVGSNVERQHVWGLGINSLILRDRDSDGDGVIDERLYALQDSHWDACAVTDAAGNVLERYEYEAYGQPRILDPGFGPRADSWFDWEVLFQGSARDAETGLYQVRNRYYHPVLGSWITRDPLFDHWGIVGGGHSDRAIDLLDEPGQSSFYSFARNSSANAVDLFGLYWSTTVKEYRCYFCGYSGGIVVRLGCVEFGPWPPSETAIPEWLRRRCGSGWPGFTSRRITVPVWIPDPLPPSPAPVAPVTTCPCSKESRPKPTPSDIVESLWSRLPQVVRDIAPIGALKTGYDDCQSLGCDEGKGDGIWLLDCISCCYWIAAKDRPSSSTEWYTNLRNCMALCRAGQDPR